jgi:hypothetical protein
MISEDHSVHKKRKPSMSLSETSPVGGLQYSTTFDAKLFGVRCDVEVVVDVTSGQTKATIAMRQLLRSMHAFRMPFEVLLKLADVVQSAHSKVSLLESQMDGAIDHKLNFEVNGASLIVVHPKGRSARFVLCIGEYVREGALDDLSAADIQEAIKLVTDLTAKVRTKVMGKK